MKRADLEKNYQLNARLRTLEAMKGHLQKADSPPFLEFHLTNQRVTPIHFSTSDSLRIIEIEIKMLQIRLEQSGVEL